MSGELSYSAKHLAGCCMRFASRDTAVPDVCELILQLKDFAGGAALSTFFGSRSCRLILNTCRAMRWGRKLTVSTLVRNSPALAV